MGAAPASGSAAWVAAAAWRQVERMCEGGDTQAVMAPPEEELPPSEEDEDAAPPEPTAFSSRRIRDVDVRMLAQPDPSRVGPAKGLWHPA